MSAVDLVPLEFIDDGCSAAPDKIFWIWDLKWACRIHDWRYCTRAHKPSEMTQYFRHIADLELRNNVRSVLPFGLGWLTALLFWRVVHLKGGDEAWNSCGPEVGERCRHGLLRRLY